MFTRPRIIPCLLLSHGGLVKTTEFQSPRYLGDPLNAVRIFNDKEVDELIILDIHATTRGSGIQFTFVEEIVAEAFVPVAYGGGIDTTEDAARLLALGVEKVVLNSAALDRPDFVSELTERFGSSTVTVSIDTRRRKGRHEVVRDNGTHRTGIDPVEWAVQAEVAGAGEIFLTSVDHDGHMEGYNLSLIAEVAPRLTVPLVVAGGAGCIDDFLSSVVAGASACAAGSMFVFQGRHRAVLINYPSQDTLDGAFGVLQ